jgi:hypothetical protein
MDLTILRSSLGSVALPTDAPCMNVRLSAIFPSQWLLGLGDSVALLLLCLGPRSPSAHMRAVPRMYLVRRSGGKGFCRVEWRRRREGMLLVLAERVDVPGESN